MRYNYVASDVFMVEPTSFGYDDQTAKTNAFQHRSTVDEAHTQAQAAVEFTAMVEQLRAHGIGVVTFRDAPTPPKPGATFPNNWLTMWSNGRVFLYPMATVSRRRERSEAALSRLRQSFEMGDILDLSPMEQQGIYLEGTGVIVFDHAHRRAYAATSPRCDARLAAEHIESLGYEPIIFDTATADGTPIYHTNVLMGVQSTTAVVCTEVITAPRQQRQVLDSLAQTGHEVVQITADQMAHFCGNVIELQNDKHERFLLMSQTAYDSFTEQQRAVLSVDKTLLPVAIPTIERAGGGSARCMVAEIFLPRLTSVSAPVSTDRSSLLAN